MTDLDLERLGDVWRQQPEPKELEELKRSGERVRRRARWLQVVDVLAALVVSAVVLFLVLRNPSSDTLVVGGGAILLLLVSQVRSRRFRQQELRSLSGSAEQMLDQLIDRVRATLKHARFGLVLSGPGMLLGIAVGYVVERRSGHALAERFNAQPGLSTMIMLVTVLAIAGAVVQTVRTIRKSRNELERLSILRESYRQEQESADLG
jgi:hypothetical protein